MTDYKAEAERSFEVLHDWQSEEGITDASMLTVAIEAQINATLYAAEQQRIACMQVERGLLRQKSGRVPGAEADQAAIEARRLDMEIREGLGLS